MYHPNSIKPFWAIIYPVLSINWRFKQLYPFFLQLSPHPIPADEGRKEVRKRNANLHHQITWEHLPRWWVSLGRRPIEATDWSSLSVSSPRNGHYHCYAPCGSARPATRSSRNCWIPYLFKMLFATDSTFFRWKLGLPSSNQYGAVLTSFLVVSFGPVGALFFASFTSSTLRSSTSWNRLFAINKTHYDYPSKSVIEILWTWFSWEPISVGVRGCTSRKRPN